MSLFMPYLETILEIPFAFCPVVAGFPSPADDYGYKKIDLNKHLIKRPAATFFMKVNGNSMLEKRIFPGDIVVIDRSIEPRNGNIVVASLNKDFTIKEFQQDENKKIYLVSGNEDFKPIEIKLEDDFEIFGVVTNVIHSCL